MDDILQFPRVSLSGAERQALWVLRMGPARRAPWTRSDREHGIHAVRTQDAKKLVAKGLARDLLHWKGCVEITEAGRECVQGMFH